MQVKKAAVALGATSLIILAVVATRDAAPARTGEPAGIAAASGICEVIAAGRQLPGAVRETSGLARSVRDPDLFWTHNDAGNEPLLYGVAADGRLVQTVTVAGATLVDWEDLESGRCGAGGCLFVGDIGDNDGARDRITVYRMAEPAPGSSVSPPVSAFHARYPDGPRDAEGLFVDGSGVIHVVTKGRESAVELYRFPAAPAPNATAVLERVRELFPRPGAERDRVTAASASPDGRWVAIRTYRTMYLYPATSLTDSGVVEPTVVDLAPLGEAQGESVVIASDGAVWTSSEAEARREQPRWSKMQCALPG